MDDPQVVHEGSLSLKGRVLFCTTWRRKYVMVRADTRQLAIYNKKVSASSSGKRAECLLIQLKQVVECKSDEASSKKSSSFHLQKSANAGAGRKIIFRCRDPDDRERWISVINDVMNGKITSKCAEFDEIVVSSDALRHYGKSRPKNPGRRLPGRVKGQTNAGNTDVISVGDDADSGVGASSELLATHATLHKSDDMEVVDDVIQQSPTAQESAQPAASPVKKQLPATPVKEQSPTTPVKEQSPTTPVKEQSPATPVKEQPTPADSDKKPAKRSSLPRLKKQKKSVDGTADDSKGGKSRKSSSFLSRLGSRLTRSLSSGGHSSDAQKGDGKEDEAKENRDAPVTEEPAKEDDEVKSSDEVETIGIKNEFRSPRDTNYAMSGETKTKHDKVILELSAIALNAKLVAQKAEALKLARMNSEDETSGEESTSGSGSVSGAGKSLSRRDSEKNIEQAAQNLRTTLKNLSEAELLELEKSEVEKREEDGSEPDDDEGKEEVATVDLDGALMTTSATAPGKTDSDSSSKPSKNETKKGTTVAIIEQREKQTDDDGVAPKKGHQKSEEDSEQVTVMSESQNGEVKGEKEGEKSDTPKADDPGKSSKDDDSTKGRSKDEKDEAEMEIHETDKDGTTESKEVAKKADTEPKEVNAPVTNGPVTSEEKNE